MVQVKVVLFDGDYTYKKQWILYLELSKPLKGKLDILKKKVRLLLGMTPLTQKLLVTHIFIRTHEHYI